MVSAREDYWHLERYTSKDIPLMIDDRDIPTPNARYHKNRSRYNWSLEYELRARYYKQGTPLGEIEPMKFWVRVGKRPITNGATAGKVQQTRWCDMTNTYGLCYEWTVPYTYGRKEDK